MKILDILNERSEDKRTLLTKLKADLEELGYPTSEAGIEAVDELKERIKKLERELVSENFSADVVERYRQWQHDCRAKDPNCSFSGSIGIGAQAVNWIDAGNKVVGDWDGKKGKGVVY